MIYYLIPLILLAAPLLGEFRMEDHIVPKSAPNTYPSEQPNYYGGGSSYYGNPYAQNMPYGSYYAVPTYDYSERFFDNPNWPNVSHEDVTIVPSGTTYYGPNYGYGGYGRRTTTINNYPYNNAPGNTPYNTAPGSTTYYYNR